jgi:hypothetical protein
MQRAPDRGRDAEVLETNALETQVLEMHAKALRAVQVRATRVQAHKYTESSLCVIDEVCRASRPMDNGRHEDSKGQRQCGCSKTIMVGIRSRPLVLVKRVVNAERHNLFSRIGIYGLDTKNNIACFTLRNCPMRSSAAEPGFMMPSSHCTSMTTLSELNDRTFATRQLVRLILRIRSTIALPSPAVSRLTSMPIVIVSACTGDDKMLTTLTMPAHVPNT